MLRPSARERQPPWSDPDRLTYEDTGAFERTQEVCTRMVSCQLLDGAGHWVQQEQAGQVIPLLLDFLRQQAAA